MDPVLAFNQKVGDANSRKTIIAIFKVLHTDEERIIFILKCMLKYNIIPEMFGDTKDAKKSEDIRGVANRTYIKSPLTQSTCVEILKMYTKSITYAPNPSEELALVYGNRSLILFKLHKYEECIQDINRSLAITNSDNLRVKLYLRKLDCLYALNCHDMEDTIKETQCLLDNMSLGDNYRKALSDKLISKEKVSVPNETKKNLYQLPHPKINSYNVEFPCASDALNVKYNEEYGRHIVATRNISPGEVLTIEKPYSFLLTPKNIHTHCSYCLEVYWALIPCEHCVYAAYCSEKCKAAAWEKYHDIECAIVPHMLKMKFNKLDIFSLRLTIQTVREATSIKDLRKELEEVDSSDPLKKGFSKNGTFPSDKYRSVLGLATNTEKRSVADLFRKTLDSSFILYYLAKCTNMFGIILKKDLSELIKSSDATFVGGLILRNEQVVPTNIHSFAEGCGLELVERGLVTLPFLSLANHSCCSNITRQCTSTHVIAYAVYPIKEGEQIFDSYGNCYAAAPKIDRQKELFHQYYFVCNCTPCQEEWPLYFDLKSYQVIVKDSKCRYKIKQALKKFNTYYTFATEGIIRDKNTLEDLFKMIEVLHECVPSPCMEMVDLVETLKRLYDLGGNQFEIPKI
ncbi:SET and MYND domain-containing protein 4 [Anthophora quadrimaculata]